MRKKRSEESSLSDKVQAVNLEVFHRLKQIVEAKRLEVEILKKGLRKKE